MSEISSTKCDVCGEVTSHNPYNLPASWVSVEVKGGGASPWSVREMAHACSKECAARLFYKLADESGGIPAAADRPLLKTGRPYR